MSQAENPSLNLARAYQIWQQAQIQMIKVETLPEIMQYPLNPGIISGMWTFDVNPPAETEHIHYAHCVLHSADSRIIQDREADGPFNLPGGSLDPNELAPYALQRELYEELGLIFKPRDLKLLGTVRSNIQEQPVVAVLYKVELEQGMLVAPPHYNTDDDIVEILDSSTSAFQDYFHTLCQWNNREAFFAFIDQLK